MAEKKTKSVSQIISTGRRKKSIARVRLMPGDGKITVTDLAKLKLHLIKKELLTGIEFKAADVKMDKDLTITDLAKMQLLLVGKNK